MLDFCLKKKSKGTSNKILFIKLDDLKNDIELSLKYRTFHNFYLKYTFKGNRKNKKKNNKKIKSEIKRKI